MDFHCPHCGEEHPDGTDRCPSTGHECTRAMQCLGSTIGGRYTLTELSGTWETGDLYFARDEKTGEELMPLVLPLQVCNDPEIRRRIMREILTVGEIGHEHIVQIHDLGRDVSGSVYVVMERLEGESLAEQVRALVLPDVRKGFRTDFANTVCDISRQ